jgi:predicted transposase YdaD
MGLVAHQDFRVVPVWEIDVREVLNREILALVPFVPLMRGADEESIRQGVSLLRKRVMGEEAEVVLALFASFVMTPEQVCRIVRWDMAVLRESPWYREIVQEGLQQGLQQGVLEGQREAILHFLKVRFDLSTRTLDQVKNQLRAVEDPALLRSLAEGAARAESLQAFLAELDGNEISA